MNITATGFVVTPAASPGIHSHSHTDECELHFFTAARASFVNAAHTCRITDGSLMFSWPCMEHSAREQDREREMRFYFLRFVPDTETKALLQQITARLPVERALKLGQQHARTFEEIRRRWNSGHPSALRAAALLCTAFLYDLAADSGPAQPQFCHPAVDRCIAAMQEHIYESFSLDNCTEIAGMGKAYLTRLFKQQTGMSPMQYYASLKMESARYLLSRTHYPVYAIAQKLGYWDEFHFSNTFKRFSGVSPRAFRSLRAEAGALPGAGGTGIAF